MPATHWCEHEGELVKYLLPDFFYYWFLGFFKINERKSLYKHNARYENRISASVVQHILNTFIITKYNYF